MMFKLCVYPEQFIPEDFVARERIRISQLARGLWPHGPIRDIEADSPEAAIEIFEEKHIGDVDLVGNYDRVSVQILNK